jgi:hypothetical protein
VMFWERDQVHRDFVHINIKISLKSHRACHVVDDIGYNRVLLFKMILLFLMVPSLDDRSTILDLIGSALSSK